jgi:PAS domain-containing protein
LHCKPPSYACASTRFTRINDVMSDVMSTLPAFDGEIRWQEWSCRAILKDEIPIEIQAVGRDINDHIMAQEALQLSEANFRKLAEFAPALIYVYRGGRLLYVNSKFEEMTSLSREQLLKMNPSDGTCQDVTE